MASADAALYLNLGSDYDVTSSADKVSAEAVIQDAHRVVDRAEAYLQQAGIL